MNSKNLINSNLQKEFLGNEYKRYIDILNNYNNHLDRCFSEYLISSYDRNTFLQQVNDSIQLLNIYYNSE